MATLRQSVLRLQSAGIISDSTAKTLFNRVRKQEEKQVRQERQIVSIKQLHFISETTGKKVKVTESKQQKLLYVSMELHAKNWKQQ